jgi:hypothetical protein
MTFAAEVQGFRLVCFGVIPFENSQVRIRTVNDKPAHWRGTLQAANFTLVNRTDQNFPPTMAGWAKMREQLNCIGRASSYR